MNAIRRPMLPELEILHQLLGAATHEASAAMSRWTSGLITLSLDEVRETPLEQACQEFGCGGELVTMVVLSIPGDVGGELILVFDEENGRRLAATLLGREPSQTSEWSALEQSALCETGNILGCAYANALTRLIGLELVPSPPQFVQDFGASVLQQALVSQAMVCNQALVCRTVFHREGEELNWNVFFIPTPALRRRMEEALHCAL